MSPRIWCTFFGLVIWIVIHVIHIADLLHYMDDTWSYEMNEALMLYEPYKSYYPFKQVQLLHLWDMLGLPHSKDKQVFGSSLEIVGLHIDPHAMKITMVPDHKLKLQMATSSWMDNWALNVYPLLKPGLQSSYAKISGKMLSHTPIFLNHSVISGLGWIASVIEDSDGFCTLDTIAWEL
ncbi:hypothetical protein K439DRAFT_1646952 [Ramaria rubella]|nr:hypothetical protein K439DRAFT_1646952 [Ramaria rubella]